MEKNKNNAYVEIKQNGFYLNLYITIPSKDGDILLCANPLVKDKKNTNKILFKVKKTLEDNK